MHGTGGTICARTALRRCFTSLGVCSYVLATMQACRAKWWHQQHRKQKTSTARSAPRRCLPHACQGGVGPQQQHLIQPRTMPQAAAAQGQLPPGSATGDRETPAKKRGRQPPAQQPRRCHSRLAAQAQALCPWTMHSSCTINNAETARRQQHAPTRPRTASSGLQSTSTRSNPPLVHASPSSAPS